MASGAAAFFCLFRAVRAGQNLDFAVAGNQGRSERNFSSLQAFLLSRYEEALSNESEDLENIEDQLLCIMEKISESGWN
jgi:hypothetical protein